MMQLRESGVPHGPDVDGVRVEPLAVEELGRAVPGGDHVFGELRVVHVVVLGQAEVCDLELPFVVHQQVARWVTRGYF